jgi:hypothetical protein
MKPLRWVKTTPDACRHSFEHSLLKACEQDLSTEETAMIYSTNKPSMRQMLDMARSHPCFNPNKNQTSPMLVVPSRPPAPKPAGPEDLSKLGLV